MKLYIVIPDVHDRPPERLSRKVYHPAYRCVEKVVEATKPDGIVYLGDTSDLESLCFFDRDKRKKMEGRRYRKDVDSMNDLLDRMDKLSPNSEKVYFIGNHEYRVENYTQYNAEMDGTMEWDKDLSLTKRGYEVIPFNKVKALGKAWFMHGIDYSKYHAANTAKIYPKTIFYGHVHDVQEYTEVSPIDVSEVRKAQSLGCLCDKNPDWLKSKPNRWVHAFGMFYLKDNGQFQMDVKHIINGETVVDKKIIKG